MTAFNWVCSCVDGDIEVVRADEHDALVARLAEAERLLRKTLEPSDSDDFCDLLNETESFLRAGVTTVTVPVAPEAK